MAQQTFLRNQKRKESLTIDCGGINPNRRYKFRTEADNREEQHCYFNISSNNKLYHTYFAERLLNRDFKIKKSY